MICAVTKHRKTQSALFFITALAELHSRDNTVAYNTSIQQKSTACIIIYQNCYHILGQYILWIKRNFASFVKMSKQIQHGRASAVALSFMITKHTSGELNALFSQSELCIQCGHGTILNNNVTVSVQKYLTPQPLIGWRFQSSTAASQKSSNEVIYLTSTQVSKHYTTLLTKHLDNRTLSLTELVRWITSGE